MSNDDIDTGKYLNECKRLGIRVRRPDIIKSSKEFRVINGEIFYSIYLIKNTGDAVLEKVLEWQKRGDRTLISFLEFVKPNKKALEALIRSGALDCYSGDMTVSEHRAKLLHNYCNSSGLSNLAYTADLFDAEIDNQWIPLTETEIMIDEKKYLGAFITRNPLSDYSEAILSSYIQLGVGEFYGGKFAIMGIVENIVKKIDKKGNELGLVKITQYNSVPITLVFYSNIWTSKLNGIPLKECVKENKIISCFGYLREPGNFIIDRVSSLIELS